MKKFPVVADADSIVVTLSTIDDGKRYELKASSKARGVKTITQGEVADWAGSVDEGTPTLLGWVKGPDPSRVAVVLQPACFPQNPCPTPLLHGCHVRAGFTKKP